jgi:hypothetical protein
MTPTNVVILGSTFDRENRIFGRALSLYDMFTDPLYIDSTLCSPLFIGPTGNNSKPERNQNARGSEKNIDMDPPGHARAPKRCNYLDLRGVPPIGRWRARIWRKDPQTHQTFSSNFFSQLVLSSPKKFQNFPKTEKLVSTFFEVFSPKNGKMEGIAA